MFPSFLANKHFARMNKTRESERVRERQKQIYLICARCSYALQLSSCCVQHVFIAIGYGFVFAFDLLRILITKREAYKKKNRTKLLSVFV